MLRISLFTCGFILVSSAHADDESAIDFLREIRPILSDSCYTCHGPDADQRQADLRLDLRESAFADRDGVPAIVAGQPEKSELYRRITSEDIDERMPPADSERQLTKGEIETIRRWIAGGANWQQHWSLVPPTRPPLPLHGLTENDRRWARTPIDLFILAQLKRRELRPSSQANKETLIRRVTLDLTGVPPTLAEVDAFLADNSPDAYEKLIDRLLGSPRYGEHMAWAWLDAARYSDTNGYQTDGTRPMWPWRDWLIDALNANQPFDEFTLEQIAGDLFNSPNDSESTDGEQVRLNRLIATGLHRNHMLNGEGGRIAEESRVEYVVNRLETTGTVWLGMTIGCARCHDHKYDPLTQKEFYELYAYFNNIDESGAVDVGRKLASPIVELPTETQKRRRSQLNAKLAEFDEKIKQLAEDSAEKKKLQSQRAETKKELDRLNESVLKTMVMRERNETRPTFILERGLYNQPGVPVEPGIPAVLPPLPEGAPNNRLGLAYWLIDDANSLTARVTVNRVWQHFFGSGLVKTTEDFGAQGELPSHPQLLDWLATEFRGSAGQPRWNVKRLHRLIVTSATYRQSSKTSPKQREQDSENRWLARFPRHRLTSAVIRDQALAVSGLLTETMHGPPVKPYQPPGIWEDFSFGKIKYEQDHGPALYRRSLYTFWRRSVGPTNMFDTSPRQVCTVRPRRTNTPLHALVLLNDVTYGEAARKLGERMLIEGGDSDQERLIWAFRVVTSRRPNEKELQVLTASYTRLLKYYRDNVEEAKQVITVGESPRAEHVDESGLAAATEFASLLLNLDETITKE